MQPQSLGNYTVYNLVTGGETNNKWSAALLEITDSPRHFHTIETELFIVISGELAIEIDGVQIKIKPGESVRITPGTIHHLQSAQQGPVRVLCLNFPAFDPADMHLIE